MWVEVFRFVGDGDIPGASHYSLQGRQELDGTYTYRIVVNDSVEIMRLPEGSAHGIINGRMFPIPERRVTNV